MLRASVLGLNDRIISSSDPWLCYYCGECNETCPKEANPGELMIEVPFSKWSHLAYRPFAIYFTNLRNKAIKLQ